MINHNIYNKVIGSRCTFYTYDKNDPVAMGIVVNKVKGMYIIRVFPGVELYTRIPEELIS